MQINEVVAEDARLRDYEIGQNRSLTNDKRPSGMRSETAWAANY